MPVSCLTGLALFLIICGALFAIGRIEWKWMQLHEQSPIVLDDIVRDDIVLKDIRE